MVGPFILTYRDHLMRFFLFHVEFIRLFMRFSEHKYSLIDLQKQVAEMRKKIERNRYDYIEFVNGAKVSTKRQGENMPYENVGQFTEA